MVHDDGVGIEPDAVTSKVSLGIIGMNERAKYLGGSFEMHGNRESGTTVIVKIPYRQ
jgi:signal transduction histidine kinase